MAEEASRHHHSHKHESSSGRSVRSGKSHHSSSSKSSGRSSKSRKNVSISIVLNALLVIAAIAFAILSKANSLYGVAIFALFNIPLLLLAYFSLKLRKIPSYEYKADVYKHYSASMLTIALPIALIASGLLLILGWNMVNDKSVAVDALPLTIGGLCGIVVNGISYYLLKRTQSKTIACNTVYVNSGIGTLISLAALGAGIALMLNEIFINADHFVTLIIAIGIIATAIWVLHTFIKRGFHMLPEGLEIEQVISTLKLNESVKNYRHLNIWTNNAEEIELSAHLSVDDLDKIDEIKREVKEELSKMGVDVVTLAFKKHREE
jgi:cobalt-zinc-cadmium efflux system protein